MLTVFTNIYFSFLFTGGMIGFLKRGSIISIVMSTVFALLLAGGIYVFDTQPEWAQVGWWVLMGTSSFLSLFGGIRWFKTGKFMPSGIIFLLSMAEVDLLWLNLFIVG